MPQTILRELTSIDAINMSEIEMFVSKNKNGKTVISNKKLYECQGYTDCKQTTFGEICTNFSLKKADEAHRKGIVVIS